MSEQERLMSACISAPSDQGLPFLNNQTINHKEAKKCTDTDQAVWLCKLILMLTLHTWPKIFFYTKPIKILRTFKVILEI